MTIDVLRVPGDYKVVTQPGGTLTLNVGSTSSGGTVVITGNLLVEGIQTTIQSIVATIKDPTILLNQGDPSNDTTNSPNRVVLGTAGIQISRGTYNNVADSPYTSAYVEWNEDYTWTFPSSPNVAEAGVFEFRVGPTYAPQTYSAIKVNAIRIDETTAPKGTDGNPRFSFFGSNLDQQNAVISVAGAGDYAGRVTDPDDIPNKKYVDDTLASGIFNAEELVVGHSYVKIHDNFTEGGVSEVFVVLDGDPLDSKTNITTGTKVMSLTANSAVFNKVQLIGNSISTVGTNTNLVLSPNGTGTTVLTSPLVFQATYVPSPTVGQTGMYGTTPAGGGTGIFFVNNSTGTPTTDEFVSRKKAIIFSLIF